jgi:hypothetical protein
VQRVQRHLRIEADGISTEIILHGILISPFIFPLFHRLSFPYLYHHFIVLVICYITIYLCYITIYQCYITIYLCDLHYWITSGLLIYLDTLPPILEITLGMFILSHP